MSDLEERKAVLAVLHSVLLRDDEIEKWESRWLAAFANVLEVSLDDSVKTNYFRSGLEKEMAGLVRKTGKYMGDLDIIARKILVDDEDARELWGRVIALAKASEKKAKGTGKQGEKKEKSQKTKSDMR